VVKIGTLILIHFFDKSEKQRKLVAQVRQRSGFKMKKEVKILRAKSVESLVLSIEHFNRPSDTGRVHAVLMLLDHAFEMLFKAIILHRGGRIREPRSEQTIGFVACVRRGLSNAQVKFLDENQALTVQMINSLRDAAQHHILNISEPHLAVLGTR